jgi:hypothetical protein
MFVSFVCSALLCLTRHAEVKETPYILFLVDARGLDYSSTPKLLQSIAKHPSDGSKNGDVGHAWIYLSYKGKTLEGGHSAGRDPSCPGYFASILHAQEKNPLVHLYDQRKDGYFERGSGGHKPTLAAYLDITEEQLHLILEEIQKIDFSNYCLANLQCTSFVRRIAYILHYDLNTYTKVSFSNALKTPFGDLLLWSDEKYRTLVLETPEALEKSLKACIDQGDMQDFTKIYHRHLYQKKRIPLFTSVLQTKERIIRYLACQKIRE